MMGWPHPPKSGTFAERKAMIDREHEVSIKRQAELVGISRGSVYYQPRPVSAADLELMRRIDELHLEHPFMGARMLRDQLNRSGVAVGRKHVGSWMARMGIAALYRKPGTSKEHPGHKVYPYLFLLSWIICGEIVIGGCMYSGEIQRAALLTKHGKERVITPVLELKMGWQIILIDTFDTDHLGTFTRDIPRYGSQLDAARKKARIGMELSGLLHGLASEGRFGVDPFIGMFPWNVECVIYVNDQFGFEVVGVAQGKAISDHCLAEDWAAVETFARAVDFPNHNLVLRPQGEDDPRIRKGIADWTSLKTAYSCMARQSATGHVFLEVDARAHANPTRMEMIRLAAEDLVKKLLSPCPACGAPGFWLVERVGGLPCADCGAPTRETRAEVHGCVKCSHRLTRERTELRFADPRRCDYCNP